MDEMPPPLPQEKTLPTKDSHQFTEYGQGKRLKHYDSNITKSKKKKHDGEEENTSNSTGGPTSKEEGVVKMTELKQSSPQEGKTPVNVATPKVTMTHQMTSAKSPMKTPTSWEVAKSWHDAKKIVYPASQVPNPSWTLKDSRKFLEQEEYKTSNWCLALGKSNKVMAL
jgi:hypothetical protein